MTDSTLIVISGPSGSGKGTVIRAVTAQVPELSHTKTYTTRQPRPGEDSYVFVDEPEFERLLKEGRIAEHVRTYGSHAYGSPSELLEDSPPTHVIVELDPFGMMGLRRRSKRRTTSVFLLPPSEQELRRRIRERGHVQDVEQRLEVAAEQIGMAWSYDFVVLNDQLRTTVEAVTTICRAEVLRSASRALLEREWPAR